MKVCITCSTGGHLDEILSIKEVFEDYDVFFITANTETTKKLKINYRTYYIKNEPRPIKSARSLYYCIIYYLNFLLHNILLIIPCSSILIKEKPDVIMGCGAEATLIVLYIGKILGSRIIYLETLTRINELSFTGKFCYWISDLFLVQWESLSLKYNRAKYWGKVL